jgi:hypothetical protein
MIRWWKGQAERAQLAQSLAEGDRRFLEVMRTKGAAGQPSAEADEAEDTKTQQQ